MDINNILIFPPKNININVMYKANFTPIYKIISIFRLNIFLENLKQINFINILYLIINSYRKKGIKR